MPLGHEKNLGQPSLSPLNIISDPLLAFMVMASRNFRHTKKPWKAEKNTFQDLKSHHHKPSPWHMASPDLFRFWIHDFFHAPNLAIL